MESFAQAPMQYGAPQPVVTTSSAPVMTAPPVYMTSPAQMSSSMTVQQQPAMQVAMTAPQVGYEQTQAMPSMAYPMEPQTMGGAAGTVLVAEPVATPAGGMVMEQQPVPTRIEAMPATTYSATPATTYQPGVMMGGAVQQEGFVQHAMHSVGAALGLGGSQINTTYGQGGLAGTTYVQGGSTYARAQLLMVHLEQCRLQPLEDMQWEVPVQQACLTRLMQIMMV